MASRAKTPAGKPGGKGKGAAEAVVPLIESNVLVAELEGAAVAREGIRDIINHTVANAVVRSEERAKMVAAAKIVTEELLSAMQAALSALQQEPDPGHASPSAYTLESEPVPCPIDTWASGALPVQKRAAAPVPASAVLGLPAAAGPRSVNLASKWETHSQGSVKSRDSKASRPNNILATKSVVSKRDLQRRNTINPKDRDPALAKPTPVIREMTSEQKQLERLRVRELKKLEAKAAAQKAERDAKLKAESDAKAAERFREALQGQNYIYGHSGEVVLLETSGPDKITSLSVVPSVKISSQEGNAEAIAAGKPSRNRPAPPAAPKPAAGASRKAAGKGKGEKAAGQSKVPSTDSFIPAASSQPPLLQTIKVAPGVTVRDPVTMAAKSVPFATTKLNKSQYTELHNKAQARQRSASKLSKTDKSEGANAASAALAASNGAAQKVETKANAAAASASTPTAQRQPSMPGDKPSPPPVVKQPSALRILVEDTPPAREAADALSPTQRYNETLLKDSAWGQNGAGEKPSPPTPHQPISEDQYREAMGDRSRLPRERPFLSSDYPMDVNHRVHLPPPLYPAYAGHGLVTGYIGETNPLSPRPSTGDASQFTVHVLEGTQRSHGLTGTFNSTALSGIHHTKRDSQSKRPKPFQRFDKSVVHTTPQAAELFE